MTEAEMDEVRRIVMAAKARGMIADGPVLSVHAPVPRQKARGRKIRRSRSNAASSTSDCP